MTEFHFGQALTRIQQTVPGRWPGDKRPMVKTEILDGRIETTNLSPKTEAEWNNYVYNPPQFFVHPEPLEFDDRADVRTKPTWDELQHAFADALAEEKIHSGRWVARDKLIAVDGVRARLTDHTPVSVEGRDMHVGEGINHMVGLIQLAETATSAGGVLPHVVLRDATHQVRSIWLNSDIRSLIQALAERENRVESAHNAAIGRYHTLVAIRDDETRSLAARAEASDEALDFLDNYETHLAAALAAYDPDVVPKDLETLRQWYIERLEAVAMARVKEIKGAKSQQGVDLSGTCNDQDVALRAIAAECAAGSIEIAAAADDIWLKQSGTWNIVTHPSLLPASEEHEGDEEPAASLGADGEYYRQLTGFSEAKEAFDTAVSKINVVAALHIPVWEIAVTGETNTHHANGETVTLAGVKHVVVSCHQPTAFTEKGNVSQSIPKATYDDGTQANLVGVGLHRPGRNSKSHSAVVFLEPTETKTVTLEFTGRNICGDSRLTVRIESSAP